MFYLVKCKWWISCVDVCVVASKHMRYIFFCGFCRSGVLAKLLTSWPRDLHYVIIMTNVVQRWVCYMYKWFQS